MQAEQSWRPRLVARARLKFDPIAKQEMLLFPEAGLALNETGAAVLRACDGMRTTAEIVEALCRNYQRVDRDAFTREVLEFLNSIRARGLLE